MVKHLGVLPDIQGFNNENDLVEELTAVVANNSISCFTPGAGILIILHVYTTKNIFQMIIFLILYVSLHEGMDTRLGCTQLL